MKPNSKKEAERWFLQAKDEFNDADELRKMKFIEHGYSS